MTKAKVAVVVPAEGADETYREMEAAGCTVSIADPSWAKGFNATREAYIDLCDGADAIIGARLEGIRITGDLLSLFPDLRIYCRYNIGYDDINIPAATELGVIVTNSPVEANWGSVAENAFAHILALLKKIRERDRHVKEGGWRDKDSPEALYLGRRLDGYAGLTIGIVGLGRVGSRLADLLQPWRVRILAFDPYVDESKYIHHNVTPADMETLLSESDVVTLHCDLNEETRALMGAEQLARMKPTAVFINTARGGLVDQDALCDALEQGEIAAAALDVLDQEPPVKQSPILGLGDKVLLAPHVAGRTRGSDFRSALPLQADALLTALRGEVPKNIVNPDALPKWRQRFAGKNLL